MIFLLFFDLFCCGFGSPAHNIKSVLPVCVGVHSVNPIFFMWNTFLPGGEFISDQVFHTWVERLKSTLIPNGLYLAATWVLSLFSFVCYSLSNLRCVNLIMLYQKQSLNTKMTVCIFFVLVDKELCLTFLLANAVAVKMCARVCVCECVCGM